MIKFEKVSYADGVIPKRSDGGSAGYDFYSTETVTIAPKTQVMIKTNIKAQMDYNTVLLLFMRSSLGIKKNLMLANTTGVIDSSYYNNEDNEGNIIGAVYNYGNEPVTIQAGDRFMQGVFVEYKTTDAIEEIINEKRTGGIGSTGV
jgi:dUTP pyrophosphatase